MWERVGTRRALIEACASWVRVVAGGYAGRAASSRRTPKEFTVRSLATATLGEVEVAGRLLLTMAMGL